MENYRDYLQAIDNVDHRLKVESVLQWVCDTFPQLDTKIAWKQPMFTHQGTFIIAFSIAKHHMSVAPERVTINRFSDEIVQSGYDHTKELVRIKWEKPVDYSLLERMIAFNIKDKEGYTAFWRK
ncbi:iron chaperone [Mangrovibacillus cuniculi]|uniref:Iron chaperone n=1 Tax=Mangrovibacillus cuniculi TaxID=2593652 RepID=A0A7S8HGR8_9BACI|nr:iron chaperone [Mangrovibacillus cuniculi]QPC48082.1 iron chaperone [Mangrovibacillus cuniculi]